MCCLYDTNTIEMAAKSKANKWSDQDFRDAFIAQYLETGEAPKNVFLFAKTAGVEETEFYEHFGSLENLEKSIWSSWIQKTIDSISKDSSYAEFTVREKLLAFYYTHFEQLKRYRSYILTKKHEIKNPLSPLTSAYRKAFTPFVSELIQEGIGSGEVADRKFISDKYSHGFLVQLGFVLNFWISDDSKDFEKTDAAIEKAVNLSFDFISKGAVDSLFDFAKFLVQNKVYQ